MNPSPADYQVELDEFAAPAAVEGTLRDNKERVEDIFRVAFNIIGVLSTAGEPCSSQSLDCNEEDRQTWLQLRGRRADVHSAKVFIRGLCSQELQMEVLYPWDLHCVFTGAKQLFLECLIRGSGAFIAVQSQGRLLLLGLTEPVVLARSRILDLVEKYERNQRIPEPHETATKSRFKMLVESRADKHTLDLLLLPSAVKEELLELASACTEPGSPRLKHRACAPTFNTPSVTQHAEESTEPNFYPQFDILDLPKTATESVSEDPQTPPFDPCHPQLHQASGDSLLLSSGTEKEFQILLKFFTTMGYQEEVVGKVLAESGLVEASQILDRIQQEQESSVPEEEEEPDLGSDDFVLGVIKSAAARCGYTEEEVLEVYRESGGASIHGLLAQLQADREGETGGPQSESARRAKDRGAVEPECETKPNKLEESRETVDEREVETRLDHYSNQIMMAYQHLGENNKTPDQAVGVLQDQTLNQRDVYLDFFDQVQAPQCTPKKNRAKAGSPPFLDQTRPKMDRHSPPTVKGPPHNVYNSGKQDSPLLDPQLNRPAMGGKAVRGKDRKRAPERGAMVTGQQRYLESLQTPFDLKLTDAPGEESLRHVIIDGSNVAMTHGLGQYFSCRGIALAVQFFWNKGHRNITVFVPQWRQKRDARIKEQKYLTELQNVGLLSYTPSREVEGKRISAHDDRFMLHLAEKADGVILTNDNLRDFIDKSPAWRNLIKKRLLQYTFVGDLFMVPDDPLGRSGPHLDEFLSKTHRSPAAGSHTYAGRVPANPIPSPPRAQTEVLQYRDHTLGGAAGVPQYRGRPAGLSREEEQQYPSNPAGVNKAEDGLLQYNSRPADVSRVEAGLQYPTRPAGVSREAPEGHTGHRRAQETECLKKQLLEVFSNQESALDIVLNCNPTVRDVNKLSEMILSFEM
ncbi:NEDD4-binding protein 1 [Acipenser ruthenus]|uniref:NEDD4-binding protein 1 n=1 Tax=Acipenser ruthenus TaxID=7906 RepID=UPI0027427519|nr:NEDD4-binding protein 1 [Acipenser ruthenus]XP_058868443.1 NEDD4-binding protein 1 [Acipenser ruthenus]